jgi:nitroreductase
VDRALPRRATSTPTSGSCVYSAAQNMLLAARALGLGATLTTLYLQFEKEAEAALGLPPNRATKCSRCRVAVTCASGISGI